MRQLTERTVEDFFEARGIDTGVHGTPLKQHNPLSGSPLLTNGIVPLYAYFQLLPVTDASIHGVAVPVVAYLFVLNRRR